MQLFSYANIIKTTHNSYAKPERREEKRDVLKGVWYYAEEVCYGEPERREEKRDVLKGVWYYAEEVCYGVGCGDDE